MTKYLDLDAIAEQVTLTVKLGGKKHAMKAPTVKDLASVLKQIESMSLNATLATEIEVMSDILRRIFPTMEAEHLDGLNPAQLQSLFQHALAALSGQVEKETEDKEGNAPAAS